MIKSEHLTKKFENNTAINDISCNIPGGCIYGLVGSNGAGKSTLMRLMTGIYKPESGSITIDDMPVYENPAAKKRFSFVPDELFFLPQSSLSRMARLYEHTFERFSNERFKKLVKGFDLDLKANLNSFSKGMKRQAATVLALSTMPDYIFFDETFDGLDPVMRKFVKNIIYSDVCERKCTAVVTSHSLRELEDTCDQLALLHKGGIVFESDVENIKTSLFKVQVAYEGEYGKERFDGTDLLSFSKKGSVSNLIVRGEREKTMNTLRSLNPILLEILPLTLEEVFIYELDARGYTFKDLII